MIAEVFACLLQVYQIFPPVTRKLARFVVMLEIEARARTERSGSPTGLGLTLTLVHHLLDRAEDVLNLFVLTCQITLYCRW